ncbi:MAG: outer membrane protein assembly factor BamD [Planctomycetota bacterium]
MTLQHSSRLVSAAIALLLVALALPRAVEAGWVWTPQTGWYNPARAVKSTAPELLEQADRAFAAEQYADAAHGYQLLLDSYPNAVEVDTALVKLVEACFQLGEYDRSLEAIDRILARKPSAETTTQVLLRKYEIAVSFLSGRKRSFFGISIGAEDYAIELLDKLVERFPFQSYSDDALYHIGAYYLRESRWEEAEVVFQRVIKDYPQSEWSGIAEYQIGASALRRLKGVDYDFAPVNEAERRFVHYLQRHPAGEKAAAARDGLKEVNRLRAQRLYNIARHYERQGAAKAVRYYLQKLLREHPETPIAPTARELLKKTGSAGDVE